MSLSLFSDYGFFSKMTARFAVVTEEEIAKIKEYSIPKNLNKLQNMV
jgi:hypothetical protein